MPGGWASAHIWRSAWRSWAPWYSSARWSPTDHAHGRRGRAVPCSCATSRRRAAPAPSSKSWRRLTARSKSRWGRKAVPARPSAPPRPSWRPRRPTRSVRGARSMNAVGSTAIRTARGQMLLQAADQRAHGGGPRPGRQIRTTSAVAESNVISCSKPKAGASPKPAAPAFRSTTPQVRGPQVPGRTFAGRGGAACGGGPGRGWRRAPNMISPRPSIATTPN